MEAVQGNAPDPANVTSTVPDVAPTAQGSVNIVNAEITIENPTTGTEVAPGSEIIDAKKNTMKMPEAVPNISSTVQGNLAHEEKVIRDQNEGMTWNVWNVEERNGLEKRIGNAKDQDTDDYQYHSYCQLCRFFFSFLLM